MNIQPTEETVALMVDVNSFTVINNNTELQTQQRNQMINIQMIALV